MENEKIILIAEEDPEPPKFVLVCEEDPEPLDYDVLCDLSIWDTF